MKYYMIVDENDVIIYMGRSKKIPVLSIEITKEQYQEYQRILKSIPSREGYTRTVILYVDGTYEVEYTEIVETED